MSATPQRYIPPHERSGKNTKIKPLNIPLPEDKTRYIHPFGKTRRTYNRKIHGYNSLTHMTPSIKKKGTIHRLLDNSEDESEYCQHFKQLKQQIGMSGNILGTRLSSDSEDIYKPIFLPKGEILDLSKISDGEKIDVETWNQYYDVKKYDDKNKTSMDELLKGYEEILDKYQRNSTPFILIKTAESHELHASGAKIIIDKIKKDIRYIVTDLMPANPDIKQELAKYRLEDIKNKFENPNDFTSYFKDPYEGVCDLDFYYGFYDIPLNDSDEINKNKDNLIKYNKIFLHSLFSDGDFSKNIGKDDINKNNYCIESMIDYFLESDIDFKYMHLRQYFIGIVNDTKSLRAIRKYFKKPPLLGIDPKWKDYYISWSSILNDLYIYYIWEYAYNMLQPPLFPLRLINNDKYIKTYDTKEEFIKNIGQNSEQNSNYYDKTQIDEGLEYIGLLLIPTIEYEFNVEDVTEHPGCTASECLYTNKNRNNKKNKGKISKVGPYFRLKKDTPIYTLHKTRLNLGEKHNINNEVYTSKYKDILETMFLYIRQKKNKKEKIVLWSNCGFAVNIPADKFRIYQKVNYLTVWKAIIDINEIGHKEPILLLDFAFNRVYLFELIKSKKVIITEINQLYYKNLMKTHHKTLVSSNEVPLKLLRYGNTNTYFWSTYINNYDVNGKMINSLPTYSDRVSQILYNIGDKSFKITDKYNITSSTFIDFVSQLQQYELVMDKNKQFALVRSSPNVKTVLSINNTKFNPVKTYGGGKTWKKNYKNIRKKTKIHKGGRGKRKLKQSRKQTI